MKNLFIAFLFLPFLAQSQDVTITYSIEGTVDSFLMIQKISKVTPDSPRPTVTESSILFKGKIQWDKFISDLDGKATEQRKQAEQLILGAGEIERTSLKVKSAMTNSNLLK